MYYINTMITFFKVVFASAILTFFKRVLFFFVMKNEKISLVNIINVVFNKQEFPYEMLSLTLVFIILAYIIKKL